MKKVILLSAAALMMLAPSCKKSSDIADINFNASFNQVVSIPPVPGYNYGDTIPAGGVEMPSASNFIQTNTQQYFDQAHVSGKNVKSATITATDIRVTSGSSNFDFLDRVEVYISASDLPEVMIAYQYTIPKGTYEVALVPVSTINLREYIKRPILNGRVQMHVNATPLYGTTMNVISEFDIIANALKNFDN